jgi:uncharacterized OB-fold protein
VRIEGLQFALAELNKMKDGVCPACGNALTTPRPFSFTCNADCHKAWIDRLVEQHGEVKHITHVLTGKTYAVPTRVILEKGISAADLPTFPEVVMK